MAQDSLDQDARKPTDYQKEVEAAKKGENLDSDELIGSMRSSMVVSSSTTPAKKGFDVRLNFNLIVGIWSSLIILVLLWFVLAGPGRPILEKGLATLLHGKATPTQIAIVATATPTRTPQPTYTPFVRRTANPTRTSVVASVISPTPPPATLAPTDSSGCRDVSTISLADVGETLCVQGKVLETVEKPTYFMVVFNSAPGSFYWVTYDLVWTQGKVGACYRTTGKIEQIGNSPMLKFNYANLPEVCP